MGAGAGCATCGREVPAGAAFCPWCGAAHAPPRGPEERRRATIVFADISGYTALSERLDHETVKSVVGDALTRLGAEVEHFGGRVDKYIGDCVMAVFGAPVSHEDDAERAVHAAIAMQSAIAELNRGIAEHSGHELALRIGVNTGEVLAGWIGSDYEVVGDAVNVASRLETAAPVGGILVGERTRRAVGDAVAFTAAEDLPLKGKREPVRVYRVAQAPAGPAVSADRRGRGSAFVGRGEELGELRRRLARVRSGAGTHTLTVLGEAGVGKSRLLHELERELAGEVPVIPVWRGRSAAFGANVAFWPLRQLLREVCAIGDGDGGEVVLAKLRQRFASVLEGGDPAGQLGLLARLLGAKAEAGAPVAEGEGESAREGFFGLVRALIEALAADSPQVIAWEDIHWADDGMLELIRYLGQWLRAPVLQICIARESLLERRPDWGAPRSWMTSVFLGPLAAEETHELIERRLGEAAETRLVAALVERAEGNPLFAEELVQHVSEGAAVGDELPDTVHGVLAARLDGLPAAERALLGHAAVVGRTFPAAALTEAADEAGIELAAGLRALRERDLIVPLGAGPAGREPDLAFRHVLIRDVVYGTLTKSVRVRKHQQVGAFLERRAGGRVEEVAPLLAEHFSCAARLAAEVQLPVDEQSALRARALAGCEAAGDRALALFANAEAGEHYAAALEFARGEGAAEARLAAKRGEVALRLGAVDEAVAAWQRCIEFHEAQGALPTVAELHGRIAAALMHRGERAAAIEHYELGIRLTQRAGPSLTLVGLYEGVATVHAQRGDGMLAVYAAEKALQQAERLGEPRAASRAHGVFGHVLGRAGALDLARENLERAVELARRSGAPETVLALLGLGRHQERVEGDSVAAAETYTEALELAERIGDVPGQIELRAELAQLALLRGDWVQLMRESAAAAELAEHAGLMGKLCLPQALRAFVHWRDGDWDGAERLFVHAGEIAERIGWSEVAFGALLGRSLAQRARGDAADAVRTLDMALGLCDRAGFTAESVQAHRARAAALLEDRRPAEAAEAAAAASAIAAGIRSPIAAAAALEAQGTVAPPPEDVAALAAAQERWAGLGRRLDAARCELLRAQRLAQRDDPGGAPALEAAGVRLRELGIRQLSSPEVPSASPTESLRSTR